MEFTNTPIDIVLSIFLAKVLIVIIRPTVFDMALIIIYLYRIPLQLGPYILTKSYLYTKYLPRSEKTDLN